MKKAIEQGVRIKFRSWRPK